MAVNSVSEEMPGLRGAGAKTPLEEEQGRALETEAGTVAAGKADGTPVHERAPTPGGRVAMDGVEQRQAGDGFGGGATAAETGAGDADGKALSNILCCLCGRSIQPNGANMCGACLKEQVDVTDGITKKGLVMIQCRRCLRWQTKNDNWTSFELESAPFLALALKRIPGIAKQEVVDAKWVWTEPHSKRLKVKITLRKEVLNKVMLQQETTVEFVVHNKQCNTCNKEFTNQTWKAVVQIRQKAGHKRTLLLLEQQILKADAHRKCLAVESVRGGMDVLFGTKNEAAEFVSFLGSVAPIRTRESTKLVSTDNHSNIRHTQHTTAVDIPTLCRDDLVILPKAVGNRLQGSLCLVHRITSVVQFLSPLSGETADMTADKYWRVSTDPLLTASSLVEFVVLDCEPSDYGSRGVSGGGKGASDGRAGKESPALWDVVVALASEVGNENHTFSVTTVLGGKGGKRGIEAGDALLGYDLRILDRQLAIVDEALLGHLDKIFNEALLKGLSRELPDIVLVKRAPAPKVHSKRYKLRSLEDKARGGEISGSGSGSGKKGAGDIQDLDQLDEAQEEIEKLMDEELCSCPLASVRIRFSKKDEVAAIMEELAMDDDPGEELLEVVEDDESQGT